MPEEISPFRIEVADAVLTDLRERLARARFPKEISGAGWTYGTDLDYLKELVEYWRTTFDWRAQERLLNGFDQYMTTVDGVQLHFIHQRSARADAMPIIITHGWPGSVVEFTKIIGPLTDPEAYGGSAEDAFNVVAPSLPGFGFSPHPGEPGYDPQRIARLFTKLMAKLGYSRYAVQGGDWGSIISTQIASIDAAHTAGLHINLCSGAPSDPQNPMAGLTPEEAEQIQRGAAFRAEELAYSQLQGTKPQTIGFSLDDSPVGLAAWIVEKFRTWCDCDGNPENVFTKDELLTNITLYWVTQTGRSSAQIYYENAHAPQGASPARINVPTACAVFPAEPYNSPRSWVANRYNLTRWTELPRGGHFAAFEQPDLFVDDVRAFFRDLRASAQ